MKFYLLLVHKLKKKKNNVYKVEDQKNFLGKSTEKNKKELIAKKDLAGKGS